MATKKFIAMVGTHHDTMGGIASVVNVYRRSGLFQRRRVCYFTSHGDGSTVRKLAIGFTSWMSFLRHLLLDRLTLVHAHVSSRASFWRKSLFLVPSIWAGVPTILHLHGSEFRIFYEKECGRRQQEWVRYVFDNCSQVLVLSEDWQKWVCAMTSNPRVEVLFNPVELRAPSLASALEPAPAILCLGRLGHRKGSYDLIAAAARLQERGLDFRLRLGGDGEVQKVRQRAVEFNVADRLDLLGWVTGEGKESALAHAAVFTLPSYNEGLPMALLEAMAAGLPIVSTPIGGIPDAVREGIDGFLIQPGDVDALAARLAHLLEDPSLRLRMGTAARQRVADLFSIDAILPKLEQVYDELLAKSRSQEALRAAKRI